MDCRQALLYTVPMKIGSRIAEARIRMGLSQKDVGDWLGISSQAVSQWERDETIPTVEHLQIILPKLGIPFDHSIEAQQIRAELATQPASKVSILGYVGAGAKMNLYAIGQGFLDEVDSPARASRSTVGVEIRGDSLGVGFNRWVAFYDDLRRPITEDLLGELCIVGLDNGDVLIKRPKAGKKPGHFDLVSQDGSVIENVRIEWAALVKHLSRR